MSLFLDTTTDGTELRRKKVSLLVELLFFLREDERGGTVLTSDGLISHICVDLGGIEPPTFAMRMQRSSQLSYRPRLC